MLKLSKWISPVVPVFMALLFCSAPAHAQDDASYQRQVRNALMNGGLMSDALRHNYNTLSNGYWYGYIRVGEKNNQVATFHLEAGYIYLFIGACDSDCSDMDLRLIGNENEGVLARDTGPDDTPRIQFQPRRSGEYTVVANMPSCNAFVGCYWAMQALWK